MNERLGVMLVGSEAERLGYPNKGEVVVQGERLIDHVSGRRLALVENVFVSGPDNYRTVYEVVP